MEQKHPHAPLFERSPVPDHSLETNTELRSTHAAGSLPLSDTSEASTRMREMGLMYHWARSTRHSFTKEIGDSLQDHIIQEALRHDYLMEAVLALTSLHIASGAENLTTIREYMNAAVHYQHQALVGLQSALGSLSRDNCDAVFIASTLVMVSTIVASLLQKEPNQNAKSTAEAMLKLTSFLHGIQSILDVGREWISNGPLRCMLNVETQLSSTSLRLPLEDLRHANGTQNHEETRAVFAHAIAMLEKATETSRSVVPWIIGVQPGFFQALRDGNDLALAIFMLWGVLLDQLGGMWWAKFSGRRLVDEISRTLNARCSRWMHIAEWSRLQAGLCE
ncbi:hypothetical protein AA0114_g12994 [Alternaria tenuissima]|uniref:C6 transcription factor n=1 Tax=Alternaria tenuissima TaxID=119927 RepID=A0A4Q4M028_9PLEO|nr:hypothetical protein AA0114_g12994 [Alternaria tenuissima]